MFDPTTLQGIPYIEGKDDCYGLCRRYYAQAYDLHMLNYARPLNFAYAGIDLIGQYVQEEGFQIKDISLHRLEPGDGLLMSFSLRGMHPGLVNHIGMYLGGGQILHHVWQAPSIIEPLTVRWKRRVMTVVRHPEVTAANKENRVEVDFIDLLPPHLRHRYVEKAS